MSTFVNVDRENSFFQWGTSRQFGRSVGGIDSYQGSNWVEAHEKLLSLMEKSIFSVLEGLRSKGKIGLHELKKSKWVDCSAHGAKAPCMARAEFVVPAPLVARILKNAPESMKEGNESIYPQMDMSPDGQIKGVKNSGIVGNPKISILAVGEGDIKFSLGYVANADPNDVLSKELEDAVQKQLSMDFT